MFCFSWFVAFILVVLMSCLIVVVVVYSFSELFVNTSELSNFIYQTSVNSHAPHHAYMYLFIRIGVGF